MPTPAKRHHLVPASFLRRFADEQGRVVVRDKATRTDRAPERVENVAVEGHFYSVADGRSDRVEQDVLGAQIEGPAKVALDGVISSDQPPFGSDREAIARFLAVQLLRGRAFRTFVDGVAAYQAKQVGTPSPGSTLTPEEFALVDRSAAEAVRAASSTVDFKVQAMLAEANLVLPHLLRRNWTLLRGSDFITGDFPFTPASFRLETGFGLGVAVADFLLAPISPSRLLFLSHRDVLPEVTLDLPESAQADVRRTLWAVAGRETYRHPKTPHPPVD